jgi:hypothetical protein
MVTCKVLLLLVAMKASSITLIFCFFSCIGMKHICMDFILPHTDEWGFTCCILCLYVVILQCFVFHSLRLEVYLCMGCVVILTRFVLHGVLVVVLGMCSVETSDWSQNILEWKYKCLQSGYCNSKYSITG